jgi:hypothetical protein
VSDYRIDSTAEADEHARIIDAWWREHRAAAPDLFLDELVLVFAMLARLPRLGAPYNHRSVTSGVRRVLMRRVRCHVYYTIDDVSRVLLIRAIWHSSRGHGPA